MFSCTFLSVCEECSYACLIACDCLCVYTTAGVLIVAAHQHTQPVYLAALSYVHCGFSTSPAVHSQPQIRAVYLTTVASSSAYKHTPSLPRCLSSLTSSHVDATVKMLQPTTPFLSVLYWAVSPQVLALIAPAQTQITMREKADDVCNDVHWHTQAPQASAGIFRAQTWAHTACVQWQAARQTPGNKHKERDACQESSCTTARITLQPDMGKSARIRSCKKLKPWAIQLDGWLTAFSSHVLFLIDTRTSSIKPSVSSCTPLVLSIFCRSWMDGSAHQIRCLYRFKRQAEVQL